MTHAAGLAFQTGNGRSSSVTGQLPGGQDGDRTNGATLEGPGLLVQYTHHWLLEGLTVCSATSPGARSMASVALA